MATTLGTSTVGLQLLESNDPPLTGRFAIDFRNSPLPSRLARLGTVLVCQAPVPSGNRRVFRVYKLYGGGIGAIAEPLAVQAGVPVEVWVNWFVPGILWTIIFF
jgi:hypothetical protein